MREVASVSIIQLGEASVAEHKGGGGFVGGEDRGEGRRGLMGNSARCLSHAPTGV